jgi:alanyl-tRNA synthetase
MEEKRRLDRELTEAKKAIALGGSGGAARHDGGEVRQIGQVRLMARTVQGIPPKDLRGLVDEGKRKIGSGIVAIVGVSDEGKAGIVVGVTDDLTGDYSAVDLVRAGAEALGGGGGGGRPDMAQAGGPDGSQAEAALAAIEKHLAAGAKSVAAGA